MDKRAIGGLVAVISVGTAGGSMYANRQLKQFYSEVSERQTVDFLTTEFDMGMMSGAAKWTSDVIPNLCCRSEKFRFRGEDKIQRGIAGYRIKSKVYLIKL